MGNGTYYFVSGKRNKNHIIFDRTFLPLYKKHANDFKYLISSPPPFLIRKSLKSKIKKRKIIFISSTDLEKITV